MLETQVPETTVGTQASETKGAIGKDGGYCQPEHVVGDLKF